MKYLKIFVLLIAALFFVVPNGFAQDEWHPPTSALVGWDEVTTLSDGTHIPELDVVFYRTYIRRAEAGEIVVASPEVVDLQYYFTFSGEGRYRVGVQAVREPEGEEEMEIESAIAWSSDPAACADGIVFGFITYLDPAAPMNLRFIQ